MRKSCVNEIGKERAVLQGIHRVSDLCVLNVTAARLITSQTNTHTVHAHALTNHHLKFVGRKKKPRLQQIYQLSARMGFNLTDVLHTFNMDFIYFSSTIFFVFFFFRKLSVLFCQIRWKIALKRHKCCSFHSI